MNDDLTLKYYLKFLDNVCFLVVIHPCTPPGGVVTRSLQESKEMKLVVEEFILLIF